jgi:hypothetical protein
MLCGELAVLQAPTPDHLPLHTPALFDDGFGAAVDFGPPSSSAAAPSHLSWNRSQ